MKQSQSNGSAGGDTNGRMMRHCGVDDANGDSENNCRG